MKQLINYICTQFSTAIKNFDVEKQEVGQKIPWNLIKKIPIKHERQKKILKPIRRHLSQFPHLKFPQQLY